MTDKLTREVELTLLANWSIGKHREDFSEIDKSLFMYKQLYEAVAEGKDPIKIASEGAIGDSSISELYGLATSDMNHAEYLDARTQALMMQRAMYVDKIKQANKESTAQLYEKIRRTEAVMNFEDFKPLATDYGETFITEIEAIEGEDNPQYGRGFIDLDRLTKGGLHRGELTIIGGRPGTGKSSIALQIAYNVAINQGYKVIFLPLEMTVNSCLERVLLQSQTVDPDFRNNLDVEGKEQIKNYLDSLEDKLKFCSALNKIEDIEKLIKAEKPYLVVVDQLSQVKPTTRSKDLRERYVEITRALKRIALEQNTAIIALSQLNRKADVYEKPNIDVLAESDSIGQDADNVFIIYSKGDPETEGNKILYMNIAKQRNGVQDKEIPLMFEGAKFRFSAIEHIYK